MRGGMPMPPHVTAASLLSVPVPSRRSPSVWLFTSVVVLTVALAGAATGYSASYRRQTVAGPTRHPAPVLAAPAPGPALAPAAAMPVRRVQVPRVDPLGRLVDDPIVGRMALHRAVPLTVLVDGKVLKVTSTARTPAQLLNDLRIPVGRADRILPGTYTSLWAGAKVRVVRVRREVATRPVALAVPTVHKPDPLLPRGMVRVAPGRAGVKVQRFAQTFADGKLVATTYLGQQLLRASQPRVVRAGTRVLVAARGAFAGYEYVDVVATAYAPWHGKGVDGTTAIGLRAGYGVVAVDPRVIPLRSVLYIEGYGRAIAGDTGGRIKGMRIDLGMDTVRLAKQWGRRTVRVFILKKAPPRNLRT